MSKILQEMRILSLWNMACGTGLLVKYENVICWFVDYSRAISQIQISCFWRGTKIDIYLVFFQFFIEECCSNAVVSKFFFDKKSGRRIVSFVTEFLDFCASLRIEPVVRFVFYDREMGDAESADDLSFMFYDKEVKIFPITEFHYEYIEGPCGESFFGQEN